MSVKYRGVEYDSMAQFAREHGLNYISLRSYIKMGFDLDTAVQRAKRVIMYKGKEYNTLKNLAKDVGVDYESMCTRIYQTGMSLEDAIELPLGNYRGIEVEYRGKKYASIDKLALAVGMQKATLHSRLRSGMSLEQAIEKPVRKGLSVLYRGKIYRSIKALAGELGISYTLLWKKIKKGIAVEEAVEYLLKYKEKR